MQKRISSLNIFPEFFFNFFRTRNAVSTIVFFNSKHDKKTQKKQIINQGMQLFPKFVSKTSKKPTIGIVIDPKISNFSVESA